MKKLYENTKDLTLYQLSIGLENLLAQVSVLKSSYSWNKYCSIFSGTQTDSISKLDTLHMDILAYQQQLQSFIENAEYFKDNSCTDKFLNGEILVVRKRAIQSLNVLNSRAHNTTDDTEKELLLEVINDLRNATNAYLAIVRNIVENNRVLQTILLGRGINYKEKYELTDI